jgi:hypothetical protein
VLFDQGIDGGHEEPAGSRIALAGGSAGKLTVDALRFVLFHANDVQTSQFGDAGIQANIGAPAGHVRGNGYCSDFSGACHNHRFRQVLFSVKQSERDSARRQFGG